MAHKGSYSKGVARAVPKAMRGTQAAHEMVMKARARKRKRGKK